MSLITKMSRHHQRHSSASSLQNLLLDDTEFSDHHHNSDSRSRSSSVTTADYDHPPHHLHHHHPDHHHHNLDDDNDDDDYDDLKELADSCCGDGDVFDPPAWRPGRFLQFADIDLSVEDEPSVRPVSLPTERLGPSHGRCGASGGAHEGISRFSLSGGGLGSSASSLSAFASSPESFSVQMDTGHLPCIRHWRPSVTRRTLVIMTSCMTVALTALTLLSFVLY